MKTALLIEDDLLKKAKAQAAVRGTTMSESVNHSLRPYLSASSSASSARLFFMLVFGRTAPRVCLAYPAAVRGEL